VSLQKLLPQIIAISTSHAPKLNPSRLHAKNQTVYL
jgi:hypothetical protein